MPEMHFYIEWPDGDVARYYSPSTVIREYFEPGMKLTIAELIAKTTEALEKASERVRAKYGFHCTLSASQSASIQTRARKFRDDESVRIVRVLLQADDLSQTEVRS